MEAITPEWLKITLLVLLAILGAVVTVGKGIETIRGWFKPRTDKDANLQKQITDHQKMLDNNKRRIDAHEAQLGETRDMNKILCVSMKALLSHEINGNSVDKLRTANDQLDTYLIGIGVGK